MIIGDLNKHIGNDSQGVVGNNPKISFGGRLIWDFLASDRFFCMNISSTTNGGPYTGFEPSNPSDFSKMSCLDLVIVSKNLEPFIETIEID